MKIFSILKPFLPALVTGGVILGCAAAPVLEAVPARLELVPVEAAALPEPSPSPAPSAARPAITLAEEEPEERPEETPEAPGTGAFPDGVYTGSARGYGGDITVQVTVENGQIMGIEILSAAGETEPFFTRAAAVIDAIIYAQTWAVDAVAGATYSSEGIKGAVENALTGETVETEAPPAVSANPAALTEISFTAPENGYADGVYVGAAQGFGGSITVQVTVSGGAITDISILSAPGETEAYFSQARGVISAMLAAQSPNVDAVAGATYSSTGIINAVKNALSQAAGAAPSPSPSPSPEVTERPNFHYPDGVYLGTGEGFGGEIQVAVTVEGGQMTAIEVRSAEDETEEFFSRALDVLDRMLAAQTAQVDAVAGATYSSQGLMDAVAAALSEAMAPEPSEEPEPSPSEEPEPSPSEEPEPSPSEEPEPSPSEEPEIVTRTETFSACATVEPDEDEDFDAYEITVTVTVTITEDGETVRRTLTDVTVESETGKTNLRYLARAMEALRDGLLAGQEMDAVAGATCSSQGILRAWAEAVRLALETEAGG